VGYTRYTAGDARRTVHRNVTNVSFVLFEPIEIFSRTPRYKQSYRERPFTDDNRKVSLSRRNKPFLAESIRKMMKTAGIPVPKTISEVRGYVVNFVRL